MNLKELNVSVQNTLVGNGMYHLAGPLLVEPSAASTDTSSFFLCSYLFKCPKMSSLSYFRLNCHDIN